MINGVKVKWDIVWISICLLVTIHGKAGENVGSGSIENQFKGSVNFVENQGQVVDQFGNLRPDVFYSAEAGGLIHHLLKDGMAIQLSRSSLEVKESTSEVNPEDSTIIYRIDQHWINSNRSTSFESGKSSGSESNYYLSHCPDGITNVPNYEEVYQRNLYPGVDVRYYSNHGNLEYDFEIEAGAGYEQIQWKLEGATSLEIDRDGALLIHTPLGTIVEDAPRVTQDGKPLAAKWRLKKNIVSFSIPGYEPSLPMIIDPVVRVWGTYLGGQGSEYIYSVIPDGNNSFVVVGRTSSSNMIATSGAYQTTFVFATDGFISRFDLNGSRIWGTYYGGTGYDEVNNVCLNSNSDLIISGRTNSSTGFATTGCHQDTMNGARDVFVAKFSGSGSRIWSTYYGGFGNESNPSCAVDAFDNIYLTGTTQAWTNIATSGTHQSSKSNYDNAFLVKFDSSGVRKWGTYLGTDGVTNGYACGLDGTGIYVTGNTSSKTGFATPGAYSDSLLGFRNAYLARFDTSGNLDWCTYFGGNATEFSYQCIIDNKGSIYIGGLTQSDSAIATPGAYSAIYQGATDGFVSKFNNSGNLLWATYIGGDDLDGVRGLHVDDDLNLYIAGYTYSDTLIATAGSHKRKIAGQGGDAFIIKLDSLGMIDWGTYYGGNAREEAYGCFSDSNGYAYMVGYTESTSDISTTGSHQVTYGGGSIDGFIVKFKACEIDTGYAQAVACFEYFSPGGKKWKKSGIYIDSLTNVSGCDSIIIVDLTIDTVDIRVTQNGVVLESLADSASYQWINCKGDVPIAGATGKTYTATENGRYKVEVVQHGCTDQSDCYKVTDVDTTIGISVSGPALIKVFPNPSDGIITLHLPDVYNHVDIKLINAQGKEIWRKTEQLFVKKELTLPDTPGIYFLTVDTIEGSKRFKILRL